LFVAVLTPSALSVTFSAYHAVANGRDTSDSGRRRRVFGQAIIGSNAPEMDSAHADQANLLAWQKQTGAKRTFLVHGEEDTMRKLAAHLTDTCVEIPESNQIFEL
jgi:metallo-beta-lactamase family protein